MAKKSKKKLTISGDGFENLVTGLGTSKDAHSYMNFKRGTLLSQNLEFISSLYSQNWLAAAVVNVPVNDMTRNWISIAADDKTSSAIEKEVRRLNVQSKFNTALKWASAYGGSIIIMMIDDGRDMAEELATGAIRNKGIKNLIVLDRWRVTAGVIDTNLLSKNYGLPEHYLVSRNGQQIHHSRVLRFDGEIPSIGEFEKNGYWGYSTFEKTWDPISNSQGLSIEIASMTKESNIDVYGIEGLNEMIALGPDGEALVTKRLTIANQLKSYINAIALDSKDTYDKKSNSFSGLAELDETFLLKVSGASRIPPSKLLGKQQAGLGDSGQASLTNYYDDVSGRQETEVRNPLQRLLNVVHASLFGTPKEVEFEFNPLWQMTQEQQAAISLSNSTRDAVYLDRGVTSVETIQKELLADNVYSNIEGDVNASNDLFDIPEVDTFQDMES